MSGGGGGGHLVGSTAGTIYQSVQLFSMFLQLVRLGWCLSAKHHLVSREQSVSEGPWP